MSSNTIHLFSQSIVSSISSIAAQNRSFELGFCCRAPVLKQTGLSRFEKRVFYSQTYPFLTRFEKSENPFFRRLIFQQLKKNTSNGFEISDGSSGNETSKGEFLVVNFYRFVFIKCPEEEVSKHHSFLQGRDIHGRIYINEQGINAQYSGPSDDALAYVEWLKEDSRFSDILVQFSPALSGHAFPRLKLRYKPSLLQLEGGISHLPLLDPEKRAIPLIPSEWRKKLQAANNNVEVASPEGGISSDQERRLLLLDVRNGYEWDVGHFSGAQRPDVDCFRSTSFGLSESELSVTDPLAGVDKVTTDILMYCTGGIRCDVYSAILRRKGFQNLYTLKGGVSHYLEEEGPAGWVGNLFVFDSRLSLPPSVFKADVVAGGRPKVPYVSSYFARCYICGSMLREFRHRNCANLDCNLLFLSCSNCMKELKGCCCLECTSAPRLRPVLPGNQRYQKWHIYRDAEANSHIRHWIWGRPVPLESAWREVPNAIHY